MLIFGGDNSIFLRRASGSLIATLKEKTLPLLLKPNCSCCIWRKRAYFLNYHFRLISCSTRTKVWQLHLTEHERKIAKSVDRFFV